MASPKKSQLFQADPELLSVLIEVSSEAVWVNELSTGKRYWLASDKNRKKYNIPLNHIGPDFWRDNVHPADVDKATRAIDAALFEPQVENFECQYRFKGENDTWYYIRDKMRFIRNENGIATRMIGLWEDVTDIVHKEKKAQSLLRKLEKDKNRFKLISELSNAVMWEVDIKKSLVYWTAGSKTLIDFGLTKENFHMDDWVNFIHPDDYQLSANRFDAAVNSSDGVYKDQYRIIKADGSIAHIIDRGLVLKDKKGVPVRAIGGWVDVTDAKRYEGELKEALSKQEKINRILIAREEELAFSEEELRQLNEQFKSSNKILIERDQIITKLQQLAKIGNWEYDPQKKEFIFSDEIYNIHGLDPQFPVSRPEEVLQFYEGNSKLAIADLIEKADKGTLDPFDITSEIVTPLGHRKWVRISGWKLDKEMEIPHIIGLTYDITYAKEAEERLKSSEEKFSKAFHNSPDLMVLMRREDWMITDINDKVFAMLGYNRQELLGTIATDLGMFVRQKDRESFFDKFYLDESIEMETEWFRKDFSIIQVLLSFNTVEFDGKLHVIATIKDISDRKIAEEKFIKAFDLSPDLILILRERDLVLVECNKRIETLSGYQREEVIGKSSHDFELWAIPEDRDRHFSTYYENQGSAFMESAFFRKDKTSFNGNISSRRINLQGEDHMLVVVRDITERKQMEQERMESEANLNAVFNNTSLLVWSVDKNYRVIKANRHFKEYMHKRYKAIIVEGRERNVIYEDQKLSEELYEEWRVKYDRALKGEKYKVIEKYNGVYAEFNFNPIIDEDQIIGVVVFAEDISERMEQEQELKEALNKIAELKLMALRSVMNPHFVFNALNSIQFFIAQNDRKNAINYLSTFSKLIRGILTHSVNNKISLDEEIEQLKNYISLEQLRFENKFDYEITIDNELDLEGIEIPPMLIQPYVENAILHGLYNKEGQGTLKISIFKEKNAILFQIEDDGIGRAASMELRKRNFPTHQSMGSALTEERLKLINSQFKVSFETSDLFDENGVPAGTCSKVWLTN